MKFPTYLTRQQTRFFLPIALNTRSKTPNVYYKLNNLRRKKRKNTKLKLWVAATHTRNYMMKDPIVDWLNIIQNKGKKRNKFNRFNEFIMNRGIEFETRLVKFINDNIYPVVTVVENTKNACTKNNYDKTIQYMKDGVPIIHSAPVKTKE